MIDISNKIQFGNYLSRIRKRRGLLRKQLATYLGCTYEAVRLWEFGKTKPNYIYLFNISSILGIDLHCLSDDDYLSRKMESCHQNIWQQT